MKRGTSIHDAFHRPATPAGRRVNAAVWILIVVSTVLLIVDLFLPTDLPFRNALAWVDNLIIAIFAAEVVLRVGSYRPKEIDFWALGATGRLRAHILGRIRFCLQPLILVDILTVLGSVPFLRGLRALRLLRLLRSNQIFRYANPFEGLALAFIENRLLYLFGLSVFGTSVLLGGLSFYLTEIGHNASIQSLPDGLWWSIVTVTTVGYGDLTPVTGLGKVVAGTLMVVGMVTLALFAGIVGSTLMSSVLSMREESFRMSNHLDHIVICGYTPGARMLLDSLRDELDLEQHTVVIFAPMERPNDVPPEFLWMEGDPTKESELDKVRLAYADAAIVVASRTEMPQHADSLTILSAFTIRRYLKRHEDLIAARKKPLYIVAEILDTENVEHARTAGADEVIETTRMGFSLLAHAVEVHGTATLLGELADVNGNSLFVGRIPEDLGHPRTFRSVSTQLKERYDMLVLGVRSPDHEDTLNPPDASTLGDDHAVIYLARGPRLPPV